MRELVISIAAWLKCKGVVEISGCSGEPTMGTPRY